jgi:NAD(P)-dependent dehydrogenase (short-subunit alcohol dehydrogenase family)
LINMTRLHSAALAPRDINVNCVCPGGVATDMVSSGSAWTTIAAQLTRPSNRPSRASAEATAALREVSVAYGRLVGAPPAEVFPQLVSSQLQRHIEPIEVARTISFLLSDDAIIIRGQAVSADGGDTPY